MRLYEGETLNLEVTKWFKQRELGKIDIKAGLPPEPVGISPKVAKFLEVSTAFLSSLT